MNFFKKLFKDKPQPVKKKKQKTSFISWLCATKPQHQQNQQSEGRGLQPLNSQSIVKKSTISIAPTNNTKIIQRVSFGYDKNEYIEQQLRGQLINISQIRIQKIQDLLGPNGLYGMINSDEPLMNNQQELGIWLKIGKNEQINSLSHIKPYFFDKIFIFFDQFGCQYSIQDILKCKQNIYLKLQPKTSIQYMIDLYQKQFTHHFAFKLMCECFNKLKITVYRTHRNQTWLQFNQQIQSSIYINNILKQIGFQQNHQQYQILQQQISTGLTLQQYIDIIQHKQKLLSKYQGQNVVEYIKNKFLQKVSRKLTPRNDSPRSAQKQVSNQDQDKQSSSQGCNRYVLSMTANTLPRQKIQQINKVNQLAPRLQKNQKNSFQQQIFQFNVYKDQKQQQAKRVAISKQRKKRSRSQDITVNDLHNSDQLDQNEFYDKE